MIFIKEYTSRLAKNHLKTQKYAIKYKSLNGQDKIEFIKKFIQSKVSLVTWKLFVEIFELIKDNEILILIQNLNIFRFYNIKSEDILTQCVLIESNNLLCTSSCLNLKLHS